MINEITIHSNNLAFHIRLLAFDIISNLSQAANTSPI